MLTRERYLVLVAIRDGRDYTMFPMMRRAFLREHLIEPNGEQPQPTDKRRARQPKRPYRVTRRGDEQIAAFDAEVGTAAPPERKRTTPIKPQLSYRQKGDTCAP